ncbi:MAG: membrane protein insertion efficiency factor YidD [Gammaproteobacteria bacterium]|nr:membrane protein insertion efficiency factor YidD [Gammaproteobacteria bacterium]
MKLLYRGQLAAKKLVHVAVRGYQLCVSPWLPACCRFYPTCSTYALEAVEQFGVLKGGYLVLMRLGRCHPLCRGGVDLVPVAFTWCPWRQEPRKKVEADPGSL